MEDYSHIHGLSSQEVQQQKHLGLVNNAVDTNSTTYPRIVIRNIFNIINLVVFPLLAILFVFQIYTEVFSFSVFLVINTVVSIIDEVRVKRQVDKLKKEFQQTAVVIRDGRQLTIPVPEIVQGDHVVGKEGEGIIADGEIIASNYLQLDESVLTGESNYIEKDKGEHVRAGSFIVTGNCVYKVSEVGKNNYLNRIGAETLRFKSTKSSLQKDGDKVIAGLVFLAIFLAMFNFIATNNSNIAIPERLLSVTTIISLIIPQTLVFLFTLSFTVSIVKLYGKGVLVRKGGSIQELAGIDVICFDKTGTITTNEMKLLDVKTFNLESQQMGSIYNAVKPQIVGVTKTQELLHEYFSQFTPAAVSEFNQVPFTSKQKYSLIYGKVDNKPVKLAFGAGSVLLKHVQEKLRAEITDYVTQQEKAGNRVLIGLFSESAHNGNWNEIPDTDQVIVFTIEETLNPGIDKLLSELAAQGIAVKIISGDSLNAVSRIAQKINIPADQITDLSVDRDNLRSLVAEKTIFTRSNPEDKVAIIKELRANGSKVAMIGDGINDVLAMKAADVSITLESAARITHDSADIVLLHNDYTKVPMIFYEGDNIIFNLKISTKIFLVKTLMGAALGLVFSLMQNVMPIHPTSTLIFSFLGSSAPSYVLVFTRQRVSNSANFFKDVLSTSITNGLLFAGLVVGGYALLQSQHLSALETNTTMILLILVLSVIFSLYLVWESGKLRKWWQLLILFIIPVTLGVFETLLPVTRYSQPDQLKVIAAAVIGLLFVAAVSYPLIKTWPLRRKLIAYGSVLLVVSVAFFLPFQDYYGVTNIPQTAVVLIGEIGTLGLAMFVAVNAIRRRLEKSSEA